jgi:hypothetical protein
MRANQLEDALAKLGEAIQEMEAVVKTMRAEHDPLAVHIFVSRRQSEIRPTQRAESAPRWS